MRSARPSGGDRGRSTHQRRRQLATDERATDPSWGTRASGRRRGGQRPRAGVDTSGWNPVSGRVRPDTAVRDLYDDLFGEYVALYPALAETMHVLAALNR